MWSSGASTPAVAGSGFQAISGSCAHVVRVARQPSWVGLGRPTYLLWLWTPCLDKWHLTPPMINLCAQFPHNFYRIPTFLTTVLFATILGNMAENDHFKISLIYKCQTTVHTSKHPFLGTPARDMRGNWKISYNVLCPAHWVPLELRDLGREQAALVTWAGSMNPCTSSASCAKWGEWEHLPQRWARLNKWGHVESLHRSVFGTHTYMMALLFFFLTKWHHSQFYFETCCFNSIILVEYLYFMLQHYSNTSDRPFI